MIKRSELSTGRYVAVLWGLCGLGIGLLTGCQSEGDSYVLELRDKILTDQLPDEEVVSLAATHAEMDDGASVRVVGRIFADGMSAFDPKTAAFNLVELPKPGHDHENPGDCPFCKREMENAATAIVQLVDDSGEILKTSAELILGLKKNQDLVVEGEANKFGDILFINANSVHVLSPEDGLLFAKRIHGALENE